MKSGLTWGKAIVGVCMVVVTYFVVTQVVLRQPDAKTDQDTCQTAQGHIDAIHYSNGYYRLALIGQPEVFLSTNAGTIRYDADTNRMLVSGSGAFVEICSLPGSKYPFRDIESGRILPEPKVVP